MTHDIETFSPVPDKPTVDGLPQSWLPRWESQGVYRFDRDTSREAVFSIDTPPPTVSGSLHVGHVFSYTHIDVMARYQRMKGANVFFPMGWDDNGLPTERRVQNYYGVSCDPTLAYDPDFEAPAKPDPKRPVPVSRQNFIELCEELTGVDEQAFETLFRDLGLSVDWSLLYTTISDSSRATAQRAFLRNAARGEAYLSEAPGLWDVTFSTAVAQAELEAREYPGHFYRVAFAAENAPVYIETTRPELIPACVALIAHPDDERYTHLKDQSVTSPVFGVRVPVLFHETVEQDKGSGIVMCCTFGDLTDVTWWRELSLPTRPVMGRNGRILDAQPQWLADTENPDAPEAYRELVGKTAFSARERMAEMLREAGALEGDPRPVKRMANFFEKGDKPLEIVTSRQWYIRNGGTDEQLRDTLVARGDDIAFVPDHMRHRYTNWVSGLNGDWLISRQRFFGVPFPVWYPLDDQGDPQYDRPLFADEASLPVDPFTDTPPGYQSDQRDEPGGFTADPDVMDTWATSSLTPQVACGWERDPELFNVTFPMDLRPQGHDIIRTWLFSTVVRSHLEFGQAPWKRAGISGWVLDPDRKKMSKSKGNVVVPDDILATYGADAVRWRAAMSRPGADSAFDEKQMKVGRRLAIKILNATKFLFMITEPAQARDAALADVTAPLDRALIATLRDVVEQATAAFEGYDYTTALESAERFFWLFCDVYIELVKERAYSRDADAASARAAAALAMDAVQRLLAPFMPFVTDEVWSWWHSGSIHAQPWPVAADYDVDGDPAVLQAAARAISAIRGAKTDAKVKQRRGITSMTMVIPASDEHALRAAQADVRAAGKVSGWALRHGDTTSALDVEFEPDDTPK